MIRLLKNIALGLLSCLLAASPAASYSPDIYYEKPLVSTPFSQVVANLPKVTDYVFGSSATAPTGCAAGGTCVAITNATQLAAAFNPALDLTGTNTVNSELEAYSQSLTAGNHVFNSDNLQLTGTLDGGGVVAPTVSGSIGANPSINTNSFTTGNIGLSATTGISVGQIVIFTYDGIYAVTGVSGSGSTATITTTALMGSGTSIGASSFVPFAFMPYYYDTTSALSAAGSTTLTFAAVPSGVAAGQFVHLYNGTSGMYSSQNYTVVSKTATTATITPALAGSDAVSNGQGIFFTPPIRSGQIWTKQYYGIPGQGKTYFAVDAWIRMPQNTVVYNTAPGFTNAASNGAYGSWAAMFLYSGTGGAFNDSSEIDILEDYNNVLRTPANIDINVRVAPAGRSSGTNAITANTTYLFNPNLWSYSAPNFTYNSATDYSTAYHHWQMLMTPDCVNVYVDGVLLKRSPYMWTSGAQFQIGLNMAIGSLQNGIGTNNLFPLASTNFASMIFNVKELKIWQK